MQEGLPFVHEKNMGSARNIRMNGHGEHELVVFSIEIIKMILNWKFSKLYWHSEQNFIVPSKCLQYRVG